MSSADRLQWSQVLLIRQARAHPSAEVVPLDALQAKNYSARDTGSIIVQQELRRGPYSCFVVLCRGSSGDAIDNN
jgi:hypothetical protein